MSRGQREVVGREGTSELPETPSTWVGSRVTTWTP